jgi:hypothetical protein
MLEPSPWKFLAWNTRACVLACSLLLMLNETPMMVALKTRHMEPFLFSFCTSRHPNECSLSKALVLVVPLSLPELPS